MAQLVQIYVLYQKQLCRGYVSLVASRGWNVACFHVFDGDHKWK